MKNIMSKKDLTLRVNSSKETVYKSEKLLFHNQIMWLSTKEAARYLSISVSNLRAKISRGQISVDGRLGRTLRFRRDKLDQLLESSLNRGELYD